MVRSDDFYSSSLRRALVGLVTVKIAGLILLFDPTGADPLLIKSVFSLGTAVVVAALLALTLYRFGRAIIPPTPVHLVVAVFAAANIASALFAESSYIAIFGERERYLGLTFVADMLLLYFAVAVAFRRSADWAPLAIAIAGAGMFAVGYAVAQSVGLDPVRWGAGEKRMIGTFGDADTFGHFLSVLFGGAVGVAALPGSRALLRRVAAAGVALIAVATATALATRGSLIGFGAVLVMVPILAFKLRGTDRRTIDTYLVRGLVVFTVLMSLVTISPLADRVRGAARAINVNDRALIYESAVAAVADRPILGYGPDNFGVAYPRYRQAGTAPILGTTVQRSAQGWPLQAGATLGVVGLVALLALLAIAMRSLWIHGLTRAPDIAAPALLASAGYWIHGVVAGDAVAAEWWPWIAFGTAAALDGVLNTTMQPIRRLPAVALVAALLVAEAVAGVSGGVALRSNQAALAANVAWEAGQADVALAAAEKSVRDDPGRAEHWNWLGRARELSGDWRGASDAYAEAAARAPYDAAYWSNLAGSRAKQLLAGDASGGGADAALATAKRAVDADPNSPRPHAVLAEIANISGAYEVALGAVAEAIRLEPGRPEYEDLAARAALSLGAPRTAATALEDLLPLHDSALLRVALAKLSLQLGERDTARRHASRALELDPQNSDARAILSQTGG